MWDIRISKKVKQSGSYLLSCEIKWLFSWKCYKVESIVTQTINQLKNMLLESIEHKIEECEYKSHLKDSKINENGDIISNYILFSYGVPFLELKRCHKFLGSQKTHEKWQLNPFNFFMIYIYYIYLCDFSYEFTNMYMYFFSDFN